MLAVSKVEDLLLVEIIPLKQPNSIDVYSKDYSYSSTKLDSTEDFSELTQLKTYTEENLTNLCICFSNSNTLQPAWIKQK